MGPQVLIQCSLEHPEHAKQKSQSLYSIDRQLSALHSPPLPSELFPPAGQHCRRPVWLWDFFASSVAAHSRFCQLLQRPDHPGSSVSPPQQMMKDCSCSSWIWPDEWRPAVLLNRRRISSFCSLHKYNKLVSQNSTQTSY